MSERLRQVKAGQDAIRELLMREWDPIGVRDVPQAQDEYDSYISQVYGMLIRREPRYKLVDFLWWAETESMGLCGNRQRTGQVVDLLKQLIQDVGGGA
jgi:hypothetical protein